jgi:hypothetical protein
MQSYDTLIEKWSPVLDESSAGVIKDHHRKAVTAAILENQERAFREEANMLAESPTNSTVTATASGAANWNPVLIALVRRAMPNLMAYDLAGVQPMTGPTGLIFAMKSRYKTTRGGPTTGDEALFNEAQTGFSGDSSTSNGSLGASGLVGATDGDADGTLVDSGASYVPGVGTGMTTEQAEALGASGGKAFAEMGFTIEKATVTAKSRALKAEYSLELGSRPESNPWSGC